MTNSTEKYLERMIEASSKKLRLLNEIQEFTKQQSQVITEETTEKLWEFINEKQKNIDMIDKLDEEFNTYFDMLKLEMNVKSLDELETNNIKGITELKKCISDIMKVIAEISQLEKENNEKVRELLNDLGREIKKLNQGKKVNQLYSSTVHQPSSYYIDKKK